MGPITRILLLLCLATSKINASTDWTNIKAIRANVQPAHSRIIGGEEVVPHSIPYQAGLRINGNSFCGGVLISPRYVLTAAHCGAVIRSVDVILGAHNITEDDELNRVVISGSAVILHENYNSSTFYNDIAVVRLAESAPITQLIQTVRLPQIQDANRNYTEQIAVASGWGLTFDVPYPTVRDMSTLLRAVNVEVVDLEECADLYNEEDIDYVNEGSICTSGYRNKGTCNGDSGGPLVIEDVLVGITSFGTDLCEACYPSVFTRVSKHLDWIYTHTDVLLNN